MARATSAEVLEWEKDLSPHGGRVDSEIGKAETIFKAAYHLFGEHLGSADW